jgi:hypothetical protein
MMGFSISLKCIRSVEAETCHPSSRTRRCRVCPCPSWAVDQSSLPIATYTRSYFLTARLSARRMVAKRSGVIMTVPSVPSRTGIPLTGGLGPAMSALEARGPHSDSIRRARTSRYSRCGSATRRDARVGHDQGSFRASCEGMGTFVAALPRHDQEPRATASDARRDGQRGGLHGLRSRDGDDRNCRQPEHGEPRRLALCATPITQTLTSGPRWRSTRRTI